MENKKPYQSKTNWVALIIALSAFLPSVQAWISENPTAFAEITALIMVVLRMITKGKIDIK
jgi:hypothetical protein